MTSGVTDWGNFAIAFRSYNKGKEFNEFILEIDADYFGTKIYSGMNFIHSGRKFEQDCKRIAEKILPSLKDAIKKQLELT